MVQRLTFFEILLIQNDRLRVWTSRAGWFSRCAGWFAGEYGILGAAGVEIRGQLRKESAPSPGSVVPSSINPMRPPIPTNNIKKTLPGYRRRVHEQADEFVSQQL
jgi:hypothetical protein